MGLKALVAELKPPGHGRQETLVTNGSDQLENGLRFMSLTAYG